MKFAVATVLVIASLASAEPPRFGPQNSGQSAPYNPSGWRPNGPSFELPQRQQVAPQQTYGAPQRQQVVPQQTYGAPQRQQAVPQQIYEAPQQTYGAPQRQQAYGAPQRQHVVPQQTYGAPQQAELGPQPTYGPPQPEYAPPEFEDRSVQTTTESYDENSTEQPSRLVEKVKATKSAAKPERLQEEKQQNPVFLIVPQPEKLVYAIQQQQSAPLLAVPQTKFLANLQVYPAAVPLSAAYSSSYVQIYQ